MDTSQLCIPKVVIRFFNINTLYILAASTLLLLIYLGQNIMDVLYLGLVTYYYVRVKRHRQKTGK